MFNLDFGPAFGQTTQMLMPSNWSDKTHGLERTLESYAAEAFKKEGSFFLLVPQFTTGAQKPIPLSEYKKILSDFTTLYLFSTKGMEEDFRFQIAMPKTKGVTHQLHIIKHLTEGKWLSPQSILKYLKEAPKTPYWQRLIAEYCFEQYGPEMHEWEQLVNAINQYTSSFDGESIAIDVFRSVNQEDRCASFLKTKALSTLRGASLYVYYTLQGNWKRDLALEKFLKDEFDKKGKCSTQLFCLAALRLTENWEQTNEYLNAYRKQARHGIDVEKILENIVKQLNNAKEGWRARMQSKNSVLTHAHSLYYLSEVLLFVNRPSEAAKMRDDASKIATASLRKNSGDPEALELKGLLLQNSPLRQDRAFAQHCRDRARSIGDAKVTTPTMSPRRDSGSPRLKVTFHAVTPSGTPR